MPHPEIFCKNAECFRDEFDGIITELCLIECVVVQTVVTSLQSGF